MGQCGVHVFNANDKQLILKAFSPSCRALLVPMGVPRVPSL